MKRVMVIAALVAAMMLTFVAFAMADDTSAAGGTGHDGSGWTGGHHDGNNDDGYPRGGDYGRKDRSSTSTGFVWNLSELVGIESNQKRLGINLSATTSAYESGGAAYASFPYNPSALRLPAGNCSGMEGFRYLIITPFTTEKVKDKDRRRVNLACEVGEKGYKVIDGCMAIDTWAFAPGRYVIRVDQSNKIAHNCLKVVFFHLPFGRATTDESTLLVLDIFDAKHFLDSYCFYQEKSEEFVKASKACQRCAVDFLAEQQMQGWQLTEAELPHDFLADRIYRERQGIAFPFEKKQPTVKMQVSKEIIHYRIRVSTGGSPFVLRLRDAYGIKTYERNGDATIDIQDKLPCQYDYQIEVSGQATDWAPFTPEDGGKYDLGIN